MDSFLGVVPFFDLHAYSYVDWVTRPDDLRSQGAFCIYFNSNLILWSPRYQNTLSRLSAESEYQSLACTTIELLWKQQLLGFRYSFTCTTYSRIRYSRCYLSNYQCYLSFSNKTSGN